MRLLRTVTVGVLVAGAPAAAQERAPAVASFDTAWAVIQRTHYDPGLNGVDWNAVREELRPGAAVAETPEQLRLAIAEMLGRLGQSHFYLIPSEAEQALSTAGPAGDGDAGMEIRLLDGALVVTSVRPAGPAARAGVRPGWLVEQAGNRRAAEVLLALEVMTDVRRRELQAWRSMQSALSGAAGATMRLSVRDERGQARDIRVRLETPTGEITRFGSLPPLRVAAEHDRLRRGNATVGLIRFNLWLPVLTPRLDAAVDALRDSDGIVIDLRGNLGGAGAMAMGFAGHFVSRRDTLGAMRMRGGTLQFVINPRLSNAAGARVQPFAGPVAILVDATTASTSEIFAGGLQRLGRARVFGSPSAGQALPAYMKPLPSGDVLVHAIADFTGPGGYRFEGTGVVPDVPVVVTRAALLAGGDPVLEAAAAWIAAGGRQ